MQETTQFVSRHPVLNITWTALLVAVPLTTLKSLASKMKMIMRREATRLINKEDAVVVDLRQCDDFHKGYITGFTNLLPNEIKVSNFDELEKHKNKPVIVVDGPGMQYQDSATVSVKVGFEQASVLKDGVAGWSGESPSLVRGK